MSPSLLLAAFVLCTSGCDLLDQAQKSTPEKAQASAKEIKPVVRRFVLSKISGDVAFVRAIEQQSGGMNQIRGPLRRVEIQGEDGELPSSESLVAPHHRGRISLLFWRQQFEPPILRSVRERRVVRIVDRPKPRMPPISGVAPVLALILPEL